MSAQRRPQTKSLTSRFEVKKISNDGTFTGYGSVFGELDSYRDVVVKGAFLQTLQEDFAAKGRKVPMLWQHEPWTPIGVYTEVKEDDYGLYVEGQCNMDVQQGRECHSLMKQGALDGLSIGYTTRKYEWDQEEVVRSLLNVKLYEISPVTFPAGDSARVVDVKSFEQFKTLSDVEDTLRDAGFSPKEAKAFIASVKRVAGQRDVDGGANQEVSAKLQNVMGILQSINVK